MFPTLIQLKKRHDHNRPIKSKVELYLMNFPYLALFGESLSGALAIYTNAIWRVSFRLTKYKWGKRTTKPHHRK